MISLPVHGCRPSLCECELPVGAGQLWVQVILQGIPPDPMRAWKCGRQHNDQFFLVSLRADGREMVVKPRIFASLTPRSGAALRAGPTAKATADGASHRREAEDDRVGNSSSNITPRKPGRPSAP